MPLVECLRPPVGSSPWPLRGLIAAWAVIYIPRGVSFSWTALAVLGVVPLVRSLEGLPASYPFLSFGLDPVEVGRHGLQAMLTLLSPFTLAKVMTVTGTTALLCWAAPRLLVPALPALVLAGSGSALVLHGGFSGHYLWPVLPWLWLAAVEGWQNVARRFPRARLILAGALIVITIANSPLWTALAREPWPDLRRASLARDDLQRLPAARSVAVQPNLIPHLPHTRTVRAVGSDYRQPGDDPEVVVLTSLGGLWPLGETGVAREIQRWSDDERYRQCDAAAIVVFSRIGCRASPAIRR